MSTTDVAAATAAAAAAAAAAPALCIAVLLLLLLQQLPLFVIVCQMAKFVAGSMNLNRHLVGRSTPSVLSFAYLVCRFFSSLFCLAPFGFTSSWSFDPQRALFSLLGMPFFFHLFFV